MRFLAILFTLKNGQNERKCLTEDTSGYFVFLTKN